MVEQIQVPKKCQELLDLTRKIHCGATNRTIYSGKDYDRYDQLMSEWNKECDEFSKLWRSING